MAQLEKEQGNMSQYHDKQAKATAAIGGLEVELANTQEALVQKEQARQEATADKKLLEQEVVAVKKDIDDVDMGETLGNNFFAFSSKISNIPPFSYQKLTLFLLAAIQKIEQEKTNRDHTIRSLNDEIANQDEVDPL